MLFRRFVSSSPAAGSALFGGSKPKVSSRAQMLARLTAAEQSSTTSTSTPAAGPSAEDTLQAIHDDFKLLQSANPFLTVARQQPKELTIAFTNRPEISFRFVRREPEEGGGIQFECPSGEGDLRVYHYDASLGGWACVKDGHNMHGLLVRDLLPFLTGLPRFAFHA